MSDVLLVEDEPDLAELVALSLRRVGLSVTWLEDGADAWQLLQFTTPRLCILDWMVPGITGLELTRRLRASEPHRALPIILLTARSADADRIAGFEAGVDDYVTKPFSRRELVARVQVLLRTAEQPRGSSQRLRVELDAWKAWCGDRPLDLTPNELRLLALLTETPRRAWSRDELLDRIWGHAQVEARTVDTYVRNLRDKLGKDRDLIQTVRGLGYRLAS